MGNKTSILHILYALFPLNYERYIEPFGGSGAVLLGKKKPDKFEVYNDYNHNLVNLFRCMRDRPMAFIKELGFYPLNSRDDFNAIRDFFRQEKFDDKYLDEELELTKIILSDLKAEEIIELYVRMKQDYDLRRAVMFLKLLRYSYSSGGKSFACQPFSVMSLFQLIEQVGKRFENTVIENQDFEVLIKHYDRDNAFFYCDPPYFSSEYVYQCGFTWDDHLRLKNTLANSKGKWLVSYNDCKEIRELYDGYSIGYLPVDKDAAFGFFQLIAARYEFRPTILTTNQPFSKWTDVFGDAVIANAIIDRLVHHCEVIKITGNSYRIKGRKIFDASVD